MNNKSAQNQQLNYQIVAGLMSSHSNCCEMTASEYAITIAQKNREKVSIVVSGSAGYEALLGMCLGENLADAIITEADLDPYSIMRVAISVNYGKGVLFICSNDEKENYLYASSFLEESGVDSEVIFARDNISPLGINDKNKRQAGAGVFFCTKIAGAAAARNLSLNETYQAVKNIRSRINSISVSVSDGVALSSNSFFDDPAGIELDMGMIGNEFERGIKLNNAEELVNRMLFHLLFASRIRKGDRVCTYISGFGGINFSTLASMNYYLKKILEEKKIEVHDMVLNPVSAKHSSMGATISIMRMDDELNELYDMPCGSLY